MYYDLVVQHAWGLYIHPDLVLQRVLGLHVNHGLVLQHVLGLHNYHGLVVQQVLGLPFNQLWFNTPHLRFNSHHRSCNQD